MRRAEDAEATDSVLMRDQPDIDAVPAANAMVTDTAQDTDGATVDLDQEAGNQRRRLWEKEEKSVLESSNRSVCQNTLKQWPKSSPDAKSVDLFSPTTRRLADSWEERRFTKDKSTAMADTPLVNSEEWPSADGLVPEKLELIEVSELELATNSDQPTRVTSTWSHTTPTSGPDQNTLDSPPGKSLKERLVVEPSPSKPATVKSSDIKTTEEESTPEEAFFSEKMHLGMSKQDLPEEDQPLSNPTISEAIILQ